MDAGRDAERDAGRRKIVRFKKNSHNVRLFVLKEKIQEGEVKKGRAKKLIQGDP